MFWSYRKYKIVKLLKFLKYIVIFWSDFIFLIYYYNVRGNICDCSGEYFINLNVNVVWFVLWSCVLSFCWMVGF